LIARNVSPPWKTTFSANIPQRVLLHAHHVL
jgi:hypothetical protein